MPFKPPLIAGSRNPQQAPEGVAVSALVFVPVASLPGSPEEGQTVLLAGDGKLYKYQGGLWSAVGAGSSRYIHNQSSPSAVWTITHNLSARPSVTLTDGAGVTIIGEVAWTDLNTVTVTLLAATTGYAYIN